MKPTTLPPAERAAWGAFPAVVRNGDLKSLEREPEYAAAKSGDREAALALVKKLITPETVEAVRQLTVGKGGVRIMPIQAIEGSGLNKIPIMYAEVLAHHLGLEVENDICQAQKVMRTGSTADHRLAFNPAFVGSVDPNAHYLIVDDTLSMGGTIASARGYIENRGGRVLGASVMTAHDGALNLAVKPEMLARIEAKHGLKMNEFWTQEFKYGIDKLTQGEAGHLRTAASVDALRTRIHAARSAAGRTLGEEAIGERETKGLKMASLADFRSMQLDRSREGHRQALDAFWATGEHLPLLRQQFAARAAAVDQCADDLLARWGSLEQRDIEQQVEAEIKRNSEAAVNFRSLQHAHSRLKRQTERLVGGVPNPANDAVETSP